MSKFVDIDKLMPDIKGIKFKDRKGVEYKAEMFIPAIASLIDDKFGDDEHGKTLAILEVVFKPQFDFMTAEWIEENISLPVINNIYLFILNHINEGQKAALRMMEKEQIKKKSILEKFSQK